MRTGATGSSSAACACSQRASAERTTQVEELCGGPRRFAPGHLARSSAIAREPIPTWRSFWKAANAGFFLPEAVSRPDCQPARLGSSRSRNQSIMSTRGFLRAIANACVR